MFYRPIFIRFGCKLLDIIDNNVPISTKKYKDYTFHIKVPVSRIKNKLNLKETILNIRFSINWHIERNNIENSSKKRS